nr:manganese efflux pump [Deltaproteobacteria bacterium]
LSIGLAMDATAVAAARGLHRQASEGLILAVLFGVFQAGMAALGWGLGAWGGPYVEAFDHWIAFGLLVGIGGKMLWDAWRGGEEAAPKAGVGTYVMLALATSIDAAAAGMTLPMLSVPPLLAIVLIGTITLGCSVIGYRLGRAVGKGFEGKLEVLGGLVLIGLGVRVLVQHL